MGSQAEFWDWFLLNEERISSFKPGDEELLDDILYNLHKYNDKLYFEISVHEKANELVVTAEGNLDEFQSVTDLISSAPNLGNWRFIAFRPPAGFEFITKYEGIEYDPKKLWFLPLVSDGPDELLGLRIGIPNYDSLIHKLSVQALWIVLDTGLGEELVSREIHYVETAALPSSPESDGYIELTELRSYVEWRNKTLNK